MRERTAVEYDGVTYAPGAKFRVVREGGSLSGWKPIGRSAWDGVGRTLHVGDVIECAGYGQGFGADPGYGVEFHDPDGEVGLMMFSPGVFSPVQYRPLPGYLEPVDPSREMVSA